MRNKIPYMNPKEGDFGKQLTLHTQRERVCMALKCTFLIIFSLFPKPDYRDQNTAPPLRPMPPPPPPNADVWGKEEGGGVGVRREGALLRRGIL